MVSPERLGELETTQEIPLRPGMRGNASVFTNQANLNSACPFSV